MGLQDQQSDFNSWYGSSEQFQIDQTLFDEWLKRVEQGEELGVHFDQSYQDQTNAAAARINAFNEHQAAQTQRTDQEAERQRQTQELNPSVADVNEGLSRSEEVVTQNSQQEQQKAQPLQVNEDIQRLTQELNTSLGDVNEGLYKGSETASNREIIINAELIKNPDGSLVAVAQIGSEFSSLPTYDYAAFAPQKSVDFSDLYDKMKAGVSTFWNVLDPSKALSAVAIQTIANSDVLMAGLGDKLKYKKVDAGPRNLGEFKINNWDNYPDNISKPKGPFRLLQGSEYEAARDAANKANRAIHNADPSLKGKQIHEIQPVKFGGSPIDISNKIPLTPSEHAKTTTWWRRLQRDLEENK